MYSKRLVLSLLSAMAVLAFLVAPSKAAILTFSDSELLSMTEKFTVDTVSSSLTAPKLKSDSPDGKYADGTAMTLSVGFGGMIQSKLDANFDPLAGIMYIGFDKTVTAGDFDTLAALFHNDNNSTWIFGLWAIDTDNYLFQSGVSDRLILNGSAGPAPKQGIASMDLSGLTKDIKQLGFFVVLDPNVSGNAPSSPDFFHVSVQAIPEPTTMAIWGLLGLTAVGGGAWRRRRAAQKS